MVINGKRFLITTQSVNRATIVSMKNRVAVFLFGILPLNFKVKLVNSGNFWICITYFRIYIDRLNINIIAAHTADLAYLAYDPSPII